MRVLYLFNRPRGDDARRVLAGEMHDNNFYGMFRLPHFGVRAEMLELEQFLPQRLCAVLRWILRFYSSHLPVYPLFFRYDIVFTSGAYGTQLVHTVLHVRRPKWVMYDFSITGLIGEGKTLHQKVFKWMVGRAAGIVTLSEREAERLRTMFPRLREKIKFIPLGVDLAYFAPRSISQKRQVFAPGLDPCRDYTTVFSATDGLVPLLVSRSRAIDDMGTLPRHVTTTFFDAHTILNAYAESKVVIVSLDIRNGINDAAGTTTVVEAMAMGKAIVATRTPTSESYIVDGVNGILVPQCDPAAMHNAIKKLLDDDVLRAALGKNAREFAEKNLDAELMAECFAEFFRAF